MRIEISENRETFPDSFGKVTYYQMKNGELIENGNVYYIDESSLLAAIFSESAEIYTCNMGKAFQRLNNIISIEKDRLSRVSGFENAVQCNYQPLQSYLAQIRTYTESTPAMTSLRGIYDTGKKISEENRYLERLGCPQLY